MTDTHVRTHRRWVPTRFGDMHVAIAGEGHPILLLHQTPRSWDEYRDVLPLLGAHHQAIALDSLGFGDSPRPDTELSVELLAEAALAVLDALEIERATVVGHHTGGVIAIELAAAAPERVERLVLSATTLVDAEARALAAAGPDVDATSATIDGDHLGELWSFRQQFYPPDRIDLLDRFVVDALRAGPNAPAGHHAVHAYRMEDRLPLVQAPALLIAPTADPFVYPHIPQLASALGAPVVEVEGGMIPLPDQLPERFAEIVLAFVAG